VRCDTFSRSAISGSSSLQNPVDHFCLSCAQTEEPSDRFELVRAEEGLALLQQIHEAAVRRRSPRLHGSPPRRQKNRSAFG
jgi:hypothetical protein